MAHPGWAADTGRLSRSYGVGDSIHGRIVATLARGPHAVYPAGTGGLRRLLRRSRRRRSAAKAGAGGDRGGGCVSVWSHRAVGGRLVRRAPGEIARRPVMPGGMPGSAWPLRSGVAGTAPAQLAGCPVPFGDCRRRAAHRVDAGAHEAGGGRVPAPISV